MFQFVLVWLLLINNNTIAIKLVGIIPKYILNTVNKSSKKEKNEKSYNDVSTQSLTDQNH